METPIEYQELDEGSSVNYWDLDRALQFEVRRTYTDQEYRWAEDHLSEFGGTVGHTISKNADVIDDHPPELRTYDRHGNVVNEIEYHPTQFENERLVCESGIVADSFRAPPGRDEPMSHTHSAAMELLMNYADTGLDCPVTMWAGTALLFQKFGQEEFDEEISALTTRDYDDLKQSAMFLTEEQGGSDVGANETRAEPTNEEGIYELYGEKWFCSNLDAEIKLVTARRPEAPPGIKGLSLFVVKPTKQTGEANDYTFRRLKDKIGTKSVPTGEVVFEGAEAKLVGEPEMGYPYMSEMVNRSRLSVTMMGLGIAGRTLLESKIHAANREAFGKSLQSHPLMREDLVDMSVDYEAALAVVFDVASFFNEWERSGEQRHRSETNDDFRRFHMLQPIIKYRATKLGTEVASYGVQIQGGNGVVSGFVTERLYRDAQIHPIWEGPENVMALDVLRAMDKEDGHEVVLADIKKRLAEVEHEALTDLAEYLEHESESLREAISRLRDADREVAEADAKQLADYIYQVYAATLLLNEAHWSLEEKANGRKAVVAERFIDRHLRNTRSRIGRDSERIASEFFDAIVRFDSIEPETLMDVVPAD